VTAGKHHRIPVLAWRGFFVQQDASIRVGERGRDSLVPAERIELPTFGLQNRCSTAELSRLKPCCLTAMGCTINGRIARSGAHVPWLVATTHALPDHGAAHGRDDSRYRRLAFPANIADFEINAALAGIDAA
jgi:hypothetical protein